MSNPGYSHLYMCTSVEKPIALSKNAIYTVDGLVDLDPEQFCHIDSDTARTLELLENNIDASNRKHSLFGFINTGTATTTGSRMLKDELIRPLCNYEILEQRLNCIDYLVQRVDTLALLMNCIKKFGHGVDLDNVGNCLIHLFNSRQSNIQMAERRLDALSTLYSLIYQVNAIVAALDGIDQPLLSVFKIALQDPAYNEILNEISSVIDLDTASRGSKGQAVSKKRNKIANIKSGVEVLFDIARQTYNVTINQLETYARELSQDDGLPWRLNYNESRGYFLSLNPNQLPKEHVLGSQYLRLNKSRTSITCTTKDLMQSNVRANVSYENSMKLANEVLSSCLSNVINNISAIYRLISIIGTIDLLTSFAKLVMNSEGKFVRPRFTSTETVISRGFHPVLETVLKTNHQEITKNDAAFSTSRQNFMLVTGPNMGGKSVFLKQIGIIQIMAQIGCYVPAEQAHIRIVHKIIARSGSSDDDNSSCSSFMWEMRGIASALRLNDQSVDVPALYLIDEVGRGTSIDDGASYSFAIAEELALRRSSFTVFATHFDQVFALSTLYNNISSYHFKYEEDDELGSNGDRRLILSHSLAPGLAEKMNYGIILAEKCGLPQEILDVAKIGLNIDL